MSQPNASGRGSFASNFGFVMAAAGSAVGLGNIWKFPYITGEYGGGAFVLVYLVCIALVGLPLMYAELIIGRRGGRDIVGALRNLTERMGAAGKAITYLTGLTAVTAGFLMLAFYSVVAGWSVYFFLLSLGLVPDAALGVDGSFDGVAASPLRSALCHTAFMVLTIVVVSAGIHNGIENLCKRLMPALVAILFGLLGYVAYEGGLGDSLSFLFMPRLDQALSTAAVLEALGHAFFTLSLGMGAMVTYGSYLTSDRKVIRDSVAIAALDTAIALLAGTVIFAVVFKAGVPAGEGPGLLFKTLPQLFIEMPGGRLVAIVFFLLVIFAAWSSAVSLLEVVVAYCVDEWGWNRRVASASMGGLIWLLGLGCATSLTLGQLSGHLFGGPIGDTSLLDALDDVVSRWMLPIGGLLIAVAAGWFLAPEDKLAGFAHMHEIGAAVGRAWNVLIKYVAPAAVLAILLMQFSYFKQLIGLAT